MASKGLHWVQRPPKSTFSSADDYIRFAEKYFPPTLIKEAIEFSLRVREKSVPNHHSLSGVRAIDEIFWNGITRAWLDLAHQSRYYRGLLPGYKPSEVFEVLIKSLSLVVSERLRSLRIKE